MRTIDWIETRRELDPHHVGCMGISGGGTCTTFASAPDPRIRAAMVSGYLNTFRDMTDQEAFDGPHSFWGKCGGKRGLPFLSRYLGA